MSPVIERLKQEVLDEEDVSYLEELEQEGIHYYAEGRAEGRAEGFEEGI